MYFVSKEDIEYYRYAVAKVCFLRVYSEFVLVEDISKSNCMRMKMRGSEEVVTIALFKLPKEKKNNRGKLVCFYQGSAYEKVKRENESNDISILKFSREFNENYSVAFEEAIRTPEQYYENIGEYAFMFEGILLKHTDAYGYNDKWFKYYKAATVKNNNHGIVDGKISFSDPKTFNDPFDVNCSFANDNDMSGLFRIFCVAPSPTEILLWSYYGDDHKGYCLEYNAKDILDIVLDTKIDGLCIIGNVDYKRYRPKQKSKLNSISFTEINFYIQAAFTKFEEWSHEKEYRFVMLSSSFSSASSAYYTVQIPVQNIFCGIKGTCDPLTNSSGASIVPRQVRKDTTEYGLTI